MKIGDCAAPRCLRTSLALLGIGVLIAACGGGGGSTPGADGMPDGGQMPDEGQGPAMTQLGTWNVMPTGPEVSDSNGVLRAYYDTGGVGHVVAGTPVQPEGMGTATWTGEWSGGVDVDSAFAPSLPLIGLTASDLQGLNGGAVVTAYFGSSVEADVTYNDIGLDAFGFSSLTSDRVSVTNGEFRPTKTQSINIQLGPTALAGTGTISGEGAFGGANAQGVAGYMGGDISIVGLGDLGTFSSVFYGTKDAN